MPTVNKIITPIQCEKCSKLFADIIRKREHIEQNTTTSTSSTINAKSVNVEELKTELRCRVFFMHFCPGTMTTHAESINSDLQRGLERRLRHTTLKRTEPVSH